MAKINKFWVVLKPNKRSLLIDILFKADIGYMHNQFRGGLHKDEIFGIYEFKEEAHKVAKSLLKKVRK